MSTEFTSPFYTALPGEEAATTTDSLFNRMVRDIPDTYPWITKDREVRPDYYCSGRPEITSLRRTTYMLLQNTAHLIEENFDGPGAAGALLAIEQGRPLPEGYTGNSHLSFPLTALVMPQLYAGYAGSIQTLTADTGPISHVQATTPKGDEGGRVYLELTSQEVRVKPRTLHTSWSDEEVQDLRAYHGVVYAAQELLKSLAKEVALEENVLLLHTLLKDARNVEWPKGLDGYSFFNHRTVADNEHFKLNNGETNVTIAGVGAALEASKAMRFIGATPTSAIIDTYPGISIFTGVSAPDGSTNPFTKTNFWCRDDARKVVVLRRGPEWSDCAFVYAPYAFTVETDNLGKSSITTRSVLTTFGKRVLQFTPR
jgi:hypothetical protein